MIQPRRRQILIAAGSLLAAPRAIAQSSQIHRVAFLSSGRQPDSAAGLKAFLAGFRALDYHEGRNFELDARYGDYSAEGTAQLAASPRGLHSQRRSR